LDAIKREALEDEHPIYQWQRSELSPIKSMRKIENRISSSSSEKRPKVHSMLVIHPGFA
jgi:hypothetical protein